MVLVARKYALVFTGGNGVSNKLRYAIMPCLSIYSTRFSLGYDEAYEVAP